jgi:hypothetical protein
MKLWRVTTVLGIAAVGSLPRPGLAEDWTLVTTIGERPVELQVTGQKVRDGNRILDERGRIFVLDEASRSYYETSLAELAAGTSAVPTKRAKNAPKEMGGTADVLVLKGRATRSIAGRECAVYLFSLGSESLEAWVASDLAPPAAYFDVLKHDFTTRPGAVARLFERMYGEMQALGTFPLSLVHHGVIHPSDWWAPPPGWRAGIIELVAGWGGRTVISRDNVVYTAAEVRTAPVPASAFEVPASFSKVQAPAPAKKR